MNYLRIVSKPFVRKQGFNLTVVRGLRSLGQPTPETHPYLMKEDEVTPGISKVEYELRRTKLITSLPEKSKVILFGHKLRYMSHKIFYPFHQNTDFLYLTGYNQPDAVTVLEKDDSTERGYTMSMFVQPKKPEIELWEGARAGLEAAVDYFGADEAHEYAKFGHHIRDLFNSDGPVYVDFPDPIALYSYEHAVKSLTSKENASSKIKPLAPIIQEHRLFKSKAEARLMRESGEISGKSFIEIMKATRPGVSEQTISALFEYECRQRGSQMLAYVPVVAGGKNALTMHYVSNNQALREGDLLLVDAGGEYNGYASDITRTWPVNGKFSKQQKDLYKAVLNVQKQCIKVRDPI
ncbi:aminopeptidase, variant 2 [Basidiobolus ranarum]|uniref:Aminopeptidase, variant 2 n=1 Tax=Basidiobolus ranarum TaxID=34480 RepID=A0ABR2X0H6_9FUNG